MNASVQLLAITAVNAARAVFGTAEFSINKAFAGGYSVIIEVASHGPVSVCTTYPQDCDMTLEFISAEAQRMVSLLARTVVSRATEATCRGKFARNR